MKQKLCKVTMIFSILVTTILFGISVSANDNITNIEDIKGHGTSYDRFILMKIIVVMQCTTQNTNM